MGINSKTDLINILNEYLEYYTLTGDPRKSSYKSSISQLNKTIDDDLFNIEKHVNELKIPKYIRNIIYELLNNSCPDSLVEIRNLHAAKLSEIYNKTYLHRSQVYEVYKDLEVALSKLVDEMYLLGSYIRSEKYCGNANILVVSEDSVLDDITQIILTDPLYKTTYNLVNDGNRIILRNKFTEFEVIVEYCKPIFKETHKLYLIGSSQYIRSLEQTAEISDRILTKYGMISNKGKLKTYKDITELFSDLGVDYTDYKDRV